MALSVLAGAVTVAVLRQRRIARERPPVARRVPAEALLGRVPGEERGEDAMDPPVALADDLLWLRDDARESSEVLAHLSLENVYTAAATAHQAPLREELLSELKARMVEDDVSVPYAHGAFQYYTRQVAGCAYPLHCRRARSGGPETVLLDENALAQGRPCCDVHFVTPSPSHGLIAIGVDFNGAETYAVSFLSPSDGSGASCSDVLEGVSGAFEWGPNDVSCFYLTMDAAHRPYRAYRHVMGTPQAADELLFEERDERFWLGLSRERSGAWALLESSSKLSSEVYAIALQGDGAAASSRPCSLGRRRERVLYSAVHASAAPDGSGGCWLVLTNEGGAVNFKVCAAPLQPPSEGEDAFASWTEVLPHSEDLFLEGIEAFSSGLVVSGRAGGSAQLWAAPLPRAALALGAQQQEQQQQRQAPLSPLRLVRLPPRESVGTMSIGLGNEEHCATAARFSFSSPRCPRCTCEVELSGALRGAGEDSEAGALWGGGLLAPASSLRILKQRAAPATQLEQYATARLWARASDGTRVPISVVWRPSAHRGPAATAAAAAPPSSSGGSPTGDSANAWLLDGAAVAGGASPPPTPPPCLLYGYGSYGASMDMSFSSSTLSLCDRGVVYAVAHVRGGGEMGRAWYEGVGESGVGGGRLLHKRNTFTDFFACAEALVEQGWAARGRLAAMGASAGGLLMGVCLNTRPELFCAVLSLVGFVDVLQSVGDPSIPLAVVEWEEWGVRLWGALAGFGGVHVLPKLLSPMPPSFHQNPNTQPSYDYMKLYSPLENVRRGTAFPPTLLTAGLHDCRVAYWEPAKFAQRLRAATARDPRDILLKVDIGAGHFSFVDRYVALRETAFEWAWLLSYLLAP